MKFMLMMHAPRGNGDWAIQNWTPGELNAHMDFMHRLNRELMEAGERSLPRVSTCRRRHGSSAPARMALPK
jgi:hypothetical protein